MSDLLTTAALEDALKKFSDWEIEGKAIVRFVEFEDFMEGIDFVNLLAEVAEDAGHHPDIDIRYTRVKIALTTHEAGGVTDADLELAQRVDNLVE